MTDQRLPATGGMKAVALFIVWGSFAQLDPGARFNLPDTLFRGVAMLAAIAGVVAAIGIWTNAAWMIYAYAAWFVLIVIIRVWHDARIEPVVWRVALGGLIVVALFGLIGFFLYRDQKQITASLGRPELDRAG